MSLDKIREILDIQNEMILEAGRTISKQQEIVREGDKILEKLFKATKINDEIVESQYKIIKAQEFVIVGFVFLSIFFGTIAVGIALGKIF